MATNDLRRTDVRTNVRINPFWLVSAEFGKADAADSAVLFGFPAAGGNYFVHEVVMNVSEAFTAVGGISEVGYGYHMTNIQAVIGLANLEEFDFINEI